MPEDPARRADPRLARTRHRVLEAAQALLMEGGWAAVTHFSVSDRCGIGRSTVYRHWPDTAALLRDAILQVMMTLEHSEPVGDLRTDLIGELEVLRRQLATPRMRQAIAAIVERAQNDPALASLPGELHAHGSQVLRQVLARGLAEGTLAPDTDMPGAVAALIGPMMFLGVMLGVPPKRTYVIRLVDDFLTVHSAHGKSAS